jgi:ferredoxin
LYLVDAESCTGCGACLDACAPGAIRMDGGKAHIGQDACSGCDACFDACPQGAIYELAEERAGSPATVPGAAAVTARVPPRPPASPSPASGLGTVAAAVLPALLKLAGSLTEYLSARPRHAAGSRGKMRTGSAPARAGNRAGNRARHRRRGS